MFKFLHYPIPLRGRMLFRHGRATSNKITKKGDDVTYCSVRLYSRQHDRYFYLLLIERELECGRARAKKYETDVFPPLGTYLGFRDKPCLKACGKTTFRAAFLNLFRFVKGGEIVSEKLVLIESEMKLALKRAKNYPELVSRYTLLHRVLEIFRKR